MSENRGPTGGDRTEWRAVPVDDRPSVDLLSWAGWIIGGELIIVGLVGLARAGFADFDLFEPVVQVAPFHFTRLAALVSVAIGAIVWGGVAGTPDSVGLRVLGAFMLVVGIVFTIEPDAFHPWLGTHTADGVHWIVIGVILAGLSMVRPFRVGRPPASSA